VIDQSISAGECMMARTLRVVLQVMLMWRLALCKEVSSAHSTTHDSGVAEHTRKFLAAPLCVIALLATDAHLFLLLLLLLLLPLLRATAPRAAGACGAHQGEPHTRDPVGYTTQ
jgi:hypothetical protein